VVLRSDETRKQLSGVPLLQPLGPEGYSPGTSERVYDALGERAALVLRGGHSVVVDAVFARPGDRERIERVAAAASVPFGGLWLDAPESVLMSRVAGRRNDPSDADPGVVRLQRSQDAGRIDWLDLDASTSMATVLSAACDRLRRQLDDVFNELAAEIV
jgi:predicted kinase